MWPSSISQRFVASSASGLPGGGEAEGERAREREGMRGVLHNMRSKPFGQKGARHAQATIFSRLSWQQSRLVIGMPSACQKKPRTRVSAVRLLMSQTQMSLKSSHRTGPGAQLHQGNGLVCTIRPRGRLGLLPPISAEGLILGKARQRAGARRAWLHLSQDMAKGISMGCLEHSLKPQSLLCGTGLGFRRRRRPMKVCTPCALPIPFLQCG